MLKTSSELLNSLQEVTLKRERLLKRLRRELTKFGKPVCSEDFIRGLLMDLRDSRQRYADLVASRVGYLRSLNDNGINTLLEYSTLIGLRNELELLTILYRYVRSGRITSIRATEILEDMESVKRIINMLSQD